MQVQLTDNRRKPEVISHLFLPLNCNVVSLDFEQVPHDLQLFSLVKILQIKSEDHSHLFGLLVEAKNKFIHCHVAKRSLHEDLLLLPAFFKPIVEPS